MSEAELHDYTLFDLFRNETAAHAGVIRDGLARLDDEPARAAEIFENMQHAAHNIWGGARLVQLESVAGLAKVLTDVFSRLQSHPELPSAMDQATLREVTTWLEQAAVVPSEELRDWVVHQAHVLGDLYEGLSAFGEGGEAVSNLDKPAAPLYGREEVYAAAGTEEERPAPSPTPAGGGAPSSAAPPASAEVPELKVDPTLLELFSTELETHSEVLNEGLLTLETNPAAREPLEALMRSAHSLKGGARVVGLDLAVRLAHIMEDCFVAAQNKKLQFNADGIDVLLHSVDMLTRLSKAASSGDHPQYAAVVPQVEQLITALETLYSGEPPPAASPAAEAIPAKAAVTSPPAQDDSLPARVQRAPAPPEPKPTIVTAAEVEHKGEAAPPPQTSPHHAEHDRTVRVTANKIERLMGLAGEVTVSARWLPPFSDSMLTLKRGHMEMTAILEKLQDLLNRDNVDPAILKELQKAREKNKEASGYLAERLNQLDVFTGTFATHTDRLYREMIGVRMRPFADGAKGFPRLVRDLARQLGKKVNFEIIGKSTEVDQDIQEKLDAPLNHLLRNAVDHGIESPRERRAAGKPESGTIRMEVGHRSGMLMITIYDDGKGIDPAKLRDKVLRKGLAGADIVEQLSAAELLDFLFLPGFSTAEQVTEVSGRGVGLDVVHSMVHEVGGVIRADSKPGQGMRFHLELPLTLSVIRTFLVEIADEPYAFPLTRIDRCLLLKPAEIEVVEERQYFRFSDNNIALVNIHDVLELNSSPPKGEEISVVVVSDRFHAYGLVVDKFIGEYDLVVRPLDPRLGKVPDISAMALMLDGSPVLIFDIEDMVHSIDKRMGSRRLRKISDTETEHHEHGRKILVVDDSITVREMERKLLEHKGYEVDVAVDGMDGWNAVRSARYDLVVSDIDMPRLNGIELVKRIKESETLQHIPVIIVSYKDTEEHRLQGLEAGANYYLTKSSFEDESFVDAVLDLIGEA